MTLPEYLRAIDTRYRAGNATEHTYRGDLQQLLMTMTTGLAVTNEPRRVACGAPDYILTRKDVPVGYIEAKDIGKPLEEQGRPFGESTIDKDLPQWRTSPTISAS